MSVSYAANNPSNIHLRTTGFDEDVLASIRNAKGIKDAEGRRVVNFRVRTDDNSQWVTIDLVAMESFSENKVNLLVPLEGQSEARKNEILLDKKTLDKIDVAVGDNLIFELPDGTLKSLKVVGIVKDASTGAGDFLAPPYAFTLMDTMQTLRQPDLYNGVFATVLDSPDDLNHIRLVGADLKDKLEKNGITVIRTRISERNKHPLSDLY